MTAANPIPDTAGVVAPSGWVNSSTAPAEVALASDWWTMFADTKLTALIEGAIDNNTDIAIAGTRVSEANALVQISGSALLPNVDAVLGVQSARDLSPFGAPYEAVGGSAGLRVSYEVDFWGRVNNLDRAQRSSLAATLAGRDTVRLSVAATVAKLYFSLVSLDAQAAITRDTISTRRESLKVVTERVQSGYASLLEQSQAEAELAATRQREAALLASINRIEATLNVLCGRVPGRIDRASSLSDLTLPLIPTTTPSDVIEHRPDIAQAEHQLLATDAGYAASRAALLPQVRLTAALDHVDSEALPEAASLWSVGGSVLAPIFDRRRLDGQVSVSEARRNAAAFYYKGAVLAAFAEVETALGNARLLQQQQDATLEQQAALQRTLGHARNRYEAGYVSYLEQVDAQRGLLSADLAAAQISEARFAAAIDLIRATGGGWRPEKGSD